MTNPLELKILLYRGQEILKDLKNASDAGVRASYRWAAQAYKEACEAYPDHPYPLYRQAHSLFYSHYKDAQKIRALLDRACAANRENPLLMLAAGWIYKSLDVGDHRVWAAWQVYQADGWGASLAPENAYWEIEGVKFPIVDTAEQALEAHRGFVAAFPAVGDA